MFWSQWLKYIWGDTRLDVSRERVEMNKCVASCHVMTPVFPLDGPCTQLSCLPCCSLPLTFALIDFWPPDRKPLQTSSSADKTQRWPAELTFDCAWWICIHCIIWLINNYTCWVAAQLSHYANSFVSPTAPDQKTSYLLSVWDGRSHKFCYPPHWQNNSSDSRGTICSPRMRKWFAHQTVRSFDAWRCDQFTKRQPQTEERCAGEVTNSLKWRQRLIVGCDLSLTASCWTHIPVAAMMDFLPKASRRPLWVERPPVGIFLTSQGPFCSCCDEIHPHMPTRGHLVSEDVSALRKEPDQQAHMGTELGNKWTFYFKKQNGSFGSLNSVFSVFFHLTWDFFPNLSFFPLKPLWCHSIGFNVRLLMGGRNPKSQRYFPTDQFLNMVLRAPEVQILSELVVSGWYVLSCLNLMDPRVSVLNSVAIGLKPSSPIDVNTQISLMLAVCPVSLLSYHFFETESEPFLFACVLF